MIDGNATTGDKLTDKCIQSLHPLIRGLAYKGVMTLKDKGIDCRIYEGYRPYSIQNKYYNTGKSKVEAGYSYHQYGLAFDCVRIIGPKAIWDDYDEIAKVFKNLGFEWGGDWKSFIDYPHFQMTFNYKAGDLIDHPVDKDGFVIINNNA